MISRTTLFMVRKMLSSVFSFSRRQVITELKVVIITVFVLQKSKYRTTGRHIEFQLPKVGVGEVWPRLTHRYSRSWEGVGVCSNPACSPLNVNITAVCNAHHV